LLPCASALTSLDRGGKSGSVSGEPLCSPYRVCIILKPLLRLRRIAHKSLACGETVAIACPANLAENTRRSSGNAGWSTDGEMQ
jgi:hypothetical protein